MVTSVPRDRHATVAQLLRVLVELQPGDVICTFLPTGNWAILRNGKQIGFIELAPQDLSHDVPPEAKLEWQE